MTIEHLKTSDLIPYARNAKKHDAAQVAKIAGSIREFGFNNPVLIDKDNGIIAGHGRVMAAQSLSLDTVPCIRLGHLTDSQRRAYILADNRLAEIGGGWDEEMLKLELSELGDLDVDLEAIGFGAEDLAEMKLEDEPEPSEVDAEPQIDKAEELRAKWGVEPGQLWELGDHRITCGDSTSAEVMKRLLGEDKPHLMVTDPPYGVEYDANWRNEAKRADGSPIGASAVGKVSNDDKADWREAWALFSGDVAYVWCAGTKSHIVALSLEACDFQMRSLIIWGKSQFAIGRSDYHEQKEPCWYAVRKGKTGHYNGDRTQSTLWEIDKPKKSETGHSTQKPIECMERPIRNNSKPGDLVYEPFSGSGTTIIACERTGRKCRAVELNPAYVAIAIQRWADATGKEPKRLA
jgi:DNA modification methylase